MVKKFLIISVACLYMAGAVCVGAFALAAILHTQVNACESTAFTTCAATPSIQSQAKDYCSDRQSVDLAIATGATWQSKVRSSCLCQFNFIRRAGRTSSLNDCQVQAIARGAIINSGNVSKSASRD